MAEPLPSQSQPNTGTPASYDSNGNGTIELSELIAAIDDYFAGGISLTVLFDIIDLYFSQATE